VGFCDASEGIVSASEAVVGAGTGVAMVIGGLVWHITEPTGPQVITVGPILSRGAAGFMLRATF
jgi:hypothetical protein